MTNIVILRNRSRNSLHRLMRPQQLTMLTTGVFLSKASRAGLLTITTTQLSRSTTHITRRLSTTQHNTILYTNALTRRIKMFRRRSTTNISTIPMRIQVMTRPRKFTRRPRRGVCVMRIRIRRHTTTTNQIRRQQRLPKRRNIMPTKVLTRNTKSSTREASIIRMLLYGHVIKIINHNSNLRRRRILLFHRYSRLIDLHHNESRKLLTRSILSNRGHHLNLHVIRTIKNNSVSRLGIQINRRNNVINMSLQSTRLLYRHLTNNLLPKTSHLATRHESLYGLYHRHTNSKTNTRSTSVREGTPPCVR